VNEPEIPCFVLIDEAYQLNVAEVKRISGIGRGRGVGLGLGYQDLPQMYDQYGKEQANAILGTVMTKIFLPGLDDVTAEYASKQLGDTTIFAKTYQDFPGKKNDNIRYAEQKRALMHAGEVRQIAAHKELLIVNDTAPPIKAAYPPIAVIKQKFISSVYGIPKVIYLGDIDDGFKFAENPQNGGEIYSEMQIASSEIEENKISNRTNLDNETNEKIVEEVVDEIFNQTPTLTETEETNMDNQPEYLTDKDDIASHVRMAESEETAAQPESSTVVLTKEIENPAQIQSVDDSDALDGLSDDVRLAFRELNARAEMEVTRSVF
jgi:hypothetical protein